MDTINIMDLISCDYDEDNNLWSGGKLELAFDTNCSIGKIIFNTLKNWPTNVLQICDIDGVSLTNAEALTWSIRIAQHLKRRHLNHENVVGIIAKNTTFVLPAAVACLLNATPFHAVNPTLDENVVKHVFGITKPKVIFCDGNIYNKVYAATKDWCPEIYTLIDHIEGVANVQELLEPTQTEMFYKPESLTLGCDQTVAILCSSGTTGLPKAVCFSNKFLIVENILVNNKTVIYTPSGLDWLTGVNYFTLSCLYGCTRIISNKPFSAEYFIEIVKKYKINFVLMAARYLSELANCPSATAESLASIKFLNFGGGLISSKTLQRIQQLAKNGANTGYALTETYMISINLNMKHPNCVGKLFPGVRVRIVAEDGKNLSYNEQGEICVYTGYAWSGYYGNTEETQRMQDAQGWLHTGDIGYFDENNLLYLVDRKKEILKYQGMHYWPTEIEHAIAELPQVEDVCVVGIYNERCGDAAGALVVKKPNCLLTEEAVIEHVAKQIESNYKHLHAGVHFVDKLPRNANCKIIRNSAKEIFLAQQNGTSN